MLSFQVEVARRQNGQWSQYIIIQKKSTKVWWLSQKLWKILSWKFRKEGGSAGGIKKLLLLLLFPLIRKSSFLGSLSSLLELIQLKHDDNGRLLVIEVKIENTISLLINIYNANTETEQLQTLSNFSNILKTFDDIHNKSIIFGGDFNLFLDICVDTNGEKNSLKKKSTPHLIQIIENYDLCDMWRILHPKTKRFPFRQNHSSGLIQRCLDYFFISNSLQEMTKYTDILAAFSTDHSPILITLSKINEFDRGKGFWKFNNSLKKMKTMLKQ